MEHLAAAWRSHRQRKHWTSVRILRRSGSLPVTLRGTPLAALSLDEILAIHRPYHSQHFHSIHPFHRRNDYRRRKIHPSDACYHRDDRYHRPCKGASFRRTSIFFSTRVFFFLLALARPAPAR